ncbi:isochorismatase family protein [Rutstroemia sp. NJR-2017a BVV2]|nr:isochorismatase family protein [Rutstroemia sp. NJR-2017a BVV2]
MTSSIHESQQPPSRVLLGATPTHWLYNPSPPSYDLTRPPAPSFPPPAPHTTIRLSTTREPILISPSQTALVIIDMQNLFLSPALGAAPDSPANVAKEVLLQSSIPAARRAGIRVVWLNWGLNEEDVEEMPASIVKAFAMKSKTRDQDKDSESRMRDEISSENVREQEQELPNDSDKASSSTGSVTQPTTGLGLSIGAVNLADGRTIDGGRLLMRDTWNTALPPDLDSIYKEGQKLTHKPDILLHKTRISGFWAGNQQNIQILQEAGIKTLLFAGTKTDVCVLSSLLDAWNVGFDVVLVKDACGTTSPECAREAVEFNCERIWGFVCGSADLEKGVDDMLSVGR